MFLPKIYDLSFETFPTASPAWHPVLVSQASASFVAFVRYIEPLVAILIVANGVMIGFQTDTCRALWNCNKGRLRVEKKKGMEFH